MITFLNDTFTITNLNYFFCRYQHLRDEFSKVTFFNFGINVLLHLAFLSTHGTHNVPFHFSISHLST